jgi:hypothetical protein
MEESNRHITSKHLTDLGFTKHPMTILPQTQQFQFKYTKGDMVVTYNGVDWLFNGLKVEFMQQLKSNKE